MTAQGGRSLLRVEEARDKTSRGSNRKEKPRATPPRHGRIQKTPGRRHSGKGQLPYSRPGKRHPGIRTASAPCKCEQFTSHIHPNSTLTTPENRDHKPREHLETALRQLHVSCMASSCANRGGHVKFCSKSSRWACRSKPETFMKGVSVYLVLRPPGHNVAPSVPPGLLSPRSRPKTRAWGETWSWQRLHAEPTAVPPKSER